MPESIPDPVAAALDEIRGRGYHNGETGAMAHRLSDAAVIDVPRLLAALDGVLAQHQRGRIVILGALCSRHEAHRHFSITSVEAASVVACQECAATVYDSCTGCGPQVRLDSCPARTAISAALLGERST